VSVNRERPHIFVIPEDDANRQIANGFQMEVPVRQFQVLEEAGGWSAVLDRFVSDHVRGMERWPARFIVLLIDFDGRMERMDVARSRIPPHLVDRVFVLGSFTTPEALKAALTSDFETIGRTIARDCRDASHAVWAHELLRHNREEIARMCDQLKQILLWRYSNR
jgi:hypothetical protein